jgi:beta-lactamase regulating signal transducer with metallopeptidase domain
MRPETLLAVIAAFVGFLLKTSLAFAICWALSKIVVSPAARFLVWFGCLAGAASYWFWLGASFAPHHVALSPPASALIPATAVEKWQIESSWLLPLSFLLRGSGALYLIALVYFLFARIKKQMHLRWVLRFAYRVPDEIEDVFRPIANSLRVGNVRLMALSGIHSPGTFGWVSPIILLPPFCLQQDRMELEIVFRHELQHIRRRDFVFMSIASLCRALLFFHPAMWYVMRRLRLESELACDLAVVGDSPERRATYAECLVRFARLNVAEKPQPWNLDFAGSSSIQLKTRIRSMLMEVKKIPGWLMGLRATLGLALIVGFLAIAPSLFIVLSYEQHQIEQPARLTSFVRPIKVQPRERSKRANHTLKLPPTARVMPANQLAVPEVPASAAVETAAARIPLRGSNSMLSNDLGPTLKRRGEATPQNSNQVPTTIRLSGQSPAYSGGPSAPRAALDSIMTTMSDIGGAGHGDKDNH